MNLRKRISDAWHFLFGDSARAFGTVSVILLLLLAVAPAKDYFREWVRYQKQYRQLIRGRGDATSLNRRFQGGLQQVWLPELGVVDRCATCHTALKEASLIDVKTQPFRPHPPMPHNLTDFGCVMCHRGQGAATTVEEAHQGTKSWEEPILPARYMESACGQCHLNRLTGTPRLNQGRDLLARYGCVHCHLVKAPDGAAMTGSDDPPPLLHVAEKTSREWIGAWLKNPQAYAETSTMPNFQLKDDEIRDISAFLIAQSTPYREAAGTVAAPSPASGDATTLQLGQSLYGESFCASCHAVQNAAGLMVGGNLGPELTRVGSKVTTAWLAAWLTDPRSYDPDTPMPHYRLDSKQVGLLAGFLAGKTDSAFAEGSHFETATPAQIAHGKTLVTERGCASCHAINGIKKPENFAPELTLVGSRPLAKIQFAAGVPHTLADYIGAKIRQPRSFGNALKMPQYSLAPRQIDALATALLAQTARAQTIPVSLRVPGAVPGTYRPAGRAGQLIEEMRCLSCHRINGRGGEMAPELTVEGSSVQRPWLVSFLKNPNTLRPSLIRRMPRFNVSDAEAGVLADYIETVYQTPSFDADSLNSSHADAAAAEKGKELFYGKYACQSCHIVDPNKDKGYIGPTLTQVGTRLTAVWIFHWLKNAQTLRPGTSEPVWNMKDDEAQALTAYLMTLKTAPPAGGTRK